MPTAENGHELHLNVGAVAPEHLLDVISVGHLRRAGDVIEVRKVLPRLSRRPDYVSILAGTRGRIPTDGLAPALVLHYR